MRLFVFCAFFEPAAGASTPSAQRAAMAKKRVSFGGESVLSFDTPMPRRSVFTSRTVDSTDATNGSVDGDSRKTLRGVDVGDYVAIVDGSPNNIGLRGYVVEKQEFLVKSGHKLQKRPKLVLEIKTGVAVRWLNASVASVRVLAR